MPSKVLPAVSDGSSAVGTQDPGALAANNVRLEVERFLGGTKSAMEAVIASLKGSATGDGALHATQEVDRMREELERLAGRVNVTPIFIECLMFASYGDTQEWVR